ncbi:DUF72 domain-containing protein [Nitratiruptor tergarcus]|uniref:Uncharacterized conserved protein YecE, DUF72 family n=1 Tax=Nitratiruptor tergarcus DSM 16512 TaxID=1069081 RepID=A0A1W1WTM1_9BACT|nr:DUF72 domain-containing protein [Nitratiruptor tergarcus]SMC09668.1 Uncharacterized conserved protein YecE, DUF72 family [Nitratiruptor tergarcus DSM 16512]
MTYIGTAGWSIPKVYAHLFPSEGTHLERYAKKFTITEINRTFYRLPRASTLQKWSEQTPPSFKFSAKLNRSFTHFHKLQSTQGLEEHIETLKNLGSKFFALLVQLPPSLEFNENVAKSFFEKLREIFSGYIALEARHESWKKSDKLLKELQIARVASDPPKFVFDSEPGGYEEFAYFRLHGSPKIYYSEYTKGFLQNLADRVKALRATDKVVIFDNTASGAAIKNALELKKLLDLK